MRNAFSALARLAGILLIICGAVMSFALSPVRLQCEYQTAPLGIDSPHPRLGWWFESSRRGEIQTGYQVVVASSAASLETGKFDLWDSGKVVSDESVHVEYVGKPLSSNVSCFWKVRLWDRNLKASEWSPTSTWTMGLLNEADWGGKWIAATAEHSYTKSPTMYGYHALEATSAKTEKWVQVDLGSAQAFDEVVLHSPIPPGFSLSDGFGFPIRFMVTVSRDLPGIGQSGLVIANSTQKDCPNPKGSPVHIPCNETFARYVNVIATKLWNRQTGPAPYCFALSEIEVLSKGKNIALHASVTAFDSVENADWNMKRLTDGEYFHAKSLSESSDPQNSAILLRKEVPVKKAVVRATAFLCGLGYSELEINGKKIGDHVLDPGFTDFSKRTLYVTYDVTKSIHPGKNDIRILLGGGWFNLATPDLFGFEKAPWSASPRARFHLKIEYSDGTSQTVVSDKSWMWGESQISFNCVRGGETIDHTRGMPTWKPVTVVDAPEGRLVSQQLPPIRVRKSINPISVKEPKPGVYVFDLGTNIAGWAALTTTGPKGTKVILKYNEALTPEGLADMRHTASHTYGRFQTDEFILSGKCETFEPQFTYHGFRYVEVSGLTERPTLDALIGKRVSTDPAIAGSFECSNNRLNKLQDLIVHAYLNNLHSIPTDCPQREKMGWMDDGCVDMETGFFNLDTPQFYRKWFNDMMDAQDANGHVTDIVPTSGWGRTRADGSPGEMADPWWGGAIVFAPWKLYQNYGDKRVLSEGYGAMKGYVDYLSSTAKHNVVTWGLGDWLDDSAGGGGRRVPVEQTSTAAYYYAATIVSQSAQLLGHSTESRLYSDLAEHIKTVYNEKFLNKESGLYAKDSQTAQALPLALGLAPLEAKAKVLEQLVESISGPRQNHISAGMVGSLYVFHALAENGRDDLAYKMLTQEGYPGWLHMINTGATSLWEAWNGDGSYNHPTLGCIGFWLYEGLGGIRPDPTGPGFKKFVIKPSIANDLTWVKAHYDSVHGRIESAWSRKGMELTLTIVVPANTIATVYIPTGGAKPVRELLTEASLAEGVKFLRNEPGFEVFQVGSGSYSFASNLQAAGH